MSVPFISVVLPCYNHETFIEERIKSVLNQSTPVGEIIFLDDASTDNSLAIAHSLLDSASCDVRYIINDTNSGSPFAQWNKGVKAACGKYVWIAETDDSCHPNLVSTLLGVLEDGSCVMAWCQSQLIDQYGTVHSSGLDWHDYVFPGVFKSNFQCDGTVFIDKYLSCRNLIHNASGVIFLRSAFIDSRPANERMHYAGDWLKWIDLCCGCRVAFVADKLNFFRQHELNRAPRNNLRLRHENILCMLEAVSCSSNSTFDHYTSVRYLGLSLFLNATTNLTFRRFLLEDLDVRSILVLNSILANFETNLHVSFAAKVYLLTLFLVKRSIALLKASSVTSRK